MNTTFPTSQYEIIADEMQQEQYSESEVISQEEPMFHAKPYDPTVETYEFPY